MTKYFPVPSMNRKEFWKNVFRLGKSEGMVDQWRRALVIIEICLIAPHSNAALERFFSVLKLVKTLIRSRLDFDILNALMRIKMSCPSLEDFSHEHCKTCVDKWYASKNRRINQKFCKTKIVLLFVIALYITLNHFYFLFSVHCLFTRFRVKLSNLKLTSK